MKIVYGRMFAAVPCVLFALAGPSMVLLLTAPGGVGEQRIAHNVSISGVDVGGLTAEEAMHVLSTTVAEELDREVTLTTPEREFTVTLRDLGGEADLEGAIGRALSVGRGDSVARALREAVGSILDTHPVELPVVLEPGRATAVVEAIAQEIACDAQDAKASVVDGELVIDDHVVGIAPDVDATVGRLVEAARLGSSETEIALEETLPEVKTADISDLHLVATFTTHFSTGQINRASNIRTAASLIDGAVVPEGAVFSVNQTTGRRTVEKGFKAAPVYSGQQVLSGIGGGVCQISTTIYNAVLEADLKVVERHQHSMPVHYVPWGRDATISYGEADFRFQNTSGGPLIMRTTVDGGYLTASLLGKGKAPAEPADDAPDETATTITASRPAVTEPVTRGGSPYETADEPPQADGTEVSPL